MFFVFLLLLPWTSLQTLQAASCCGGSSGSSTLLTNDESSMLGVAFSQSYVQDDVYDYYWKKRNTNDTAQKLILEGAHIFSDRWQSGISAPFVRRFNEKSPERIKKKEQRPHLGDLKLQVAYEVLPEWEYHPWKPKGFLYFIVTAPTGTSWLNSSEDKTVFVTGRGRWGAGSGLLLKKLWSTSPRLWNGLWDLFLQNEAQQFFSKTKNNVRYHTYWTVQNQLGFGYNKDRWRLGSSLEHFYESSHKTSGNLETKSMFQRFTTWSASLSYLFEGSLSTSLIYSDQTIFGSPKNTTLNRSLSFVLQKRWPR